MPDPTPADPSPAPVKPGYKTTEFYLHFGVQAALATLALVPGALPSAGLPPLAEAAIKLAIPAIMAWLAKSYQDGRNTAKAAPASAAEMVNG